MADRTPLYDTHVEMDARIVDFGGWDMPLHYGSQIEEHHAVRQDAGMFDVSHMTVVDLKGPGARGFLERLLANDVGKLKTPGKALYSCMLTPDAGVIDDLIVYFFADDDYRMVVNAATRDKDLAWLAKVAADFDLEVIERIEPPKSSAKLIKALRTALEAQPGFRQAFDDRISRQVRMLDAARRLEKQERYESALWFVEQIVESDLRVDPSYDRAVELKRNLDRKLKRERARAKTAK